MRSVSARHLIAEFTVGLLVIGKIALVSAAAIRIGCAGHLFVFVALSAPGSCDGWWLLLMGGIVKQWASLRQSEASPAS